MPRVFNACTVDSDNYNTLRAFDAELFNRVQVQAGINVRYMFYDVYRESTRLLNRTLLNEITFVIETRVNTHA
jgi:hypothetical protein